MRLFFNAILLILTIHPASAAPLADQERAFVAGMVGAMLLGSKCPNLQMVDDVGRSFADQHGVNFNKIGEALINAILAGSGKPYQTGKLIPEVTREVNYAALDLSRGLKADPVRTCNEWADNLVPLGLMKRVR